MPQKVQYTEMVQQSCTSAVYLMYIQIIGVNLLKGTVVRNEEKHVGECNSITCLKCETLESTCNVIINS